MDKAKTMPLTSGTHMFLCADLVDYKHQLSVQFVYKHFPTLKY